MSQSKNLLHVQRAKNGGKRKWQTRINKGLDVVHHYVRGKNRKAVKT